MRVSFVKEFYQKKEFHRVLDVKGFRQKGFSNLRWFLFAVNAGAVLDCNLTIRAIDIIFLYYLDR